MAKKSFMHTKAAEQLNQGPTALFITPTAKTQEETVEKEPEREPDKVPENKDENQPVQEATVKEEVAQVKDEPQQETKSVVKKRKEAFKLEPVKKESKSKKILFLLKPSLFEKLKAYSKETGESMNEIINQMIDKCL